MPEILALNDVVHQLKDGRWVVARWDEKANQWQAPMTAQEAKATNCSAYFAKGPNGLERLGCTSYAQRSGAVRRAKQTYYGIQ
jgi:hypothetical protein